MKLVFVTDNGFSEQNGEYYYSEANVQHYFTVTQHFEDIIFIGRNNPFNVNHSLNKIPKKYKVYLVDSITNGKNFVSNYKKLNKILDEAIKQSDIVMCFGINGFLAYKKAKKYNKPIITYIGGCVYDTLKNMGSKIKKISALIIKSMIKNMVKKSDFVHYVDKYLVDKYPTNGKFLICPSVRISMNSNILSLRINKISNQKDVILIGLIGYTHNRIKGIDTAIKALKILGKEYKLQVVGRGEHQWLENLAKSLKVENQVEFLGVLNRDALFRWLDNIDIYIQPSLTEGMPRATIEAMSRGCPVISTDVGGLVNIVDSNYMIKPGKYVELANRIKTLKENKPLMIKQSIKNYETAKEFDSTLLDEKRKEFYSMIRESIKYYQLKR